MLPDACRKGPAPARGCPHPSGILVFTLLVGGCDMRAFDFAPLYRSTVGFDRLFDMLDASPQAPAMTNWPPYNIEKTSEDKYRITMAIAGFRPNEIELVQQDNTLLVVGAKQPDGEG